MIKFLLTSLILCCSCKGTVQTIKGKYTSDYLLKIDSINIINSFYIIHVQRNDSIFRIISKKQDIKSAPCENIEIGKSYSLDLRIVFHPDSILGVKVMNPLDVRNMILEDGSTIKIEESSHYKIYESDNLKGLYYKKSN